MASSKPKLGSIYERDQTYRIKYSVKGQSFRESSDSRNAADAERLLKRRVGEIGLGKFSGLAHERVTMGELFDDLIDDYKINRRKMLPHLLSRLKLHLSPPFASLRVSGLNSSQLKHYTAKRIKAGAAPGTVNRELEFMERALRLGSQCDPPKVVKTIRVPSLEADSVRTGFLDDGGDLNLRRDQLDFSNNQIVLNPGTTKNGMGRTLPIYGDMKEWLLAQQAERDSKQPTCPYLFAHDGHRITEFRKAWALACERAGLKGLLFHDLRRSAVRNLRMAGVAENVAIQIAGHKTRSIFDRYSIVGGQGVQDAAAKLEKRLKSSLGTVDGKGAKEDEDGQDDDGGKPLKE